MGSIQRVSQGAWQVQAGGADQQTAVLKPLDIHHPLQRVLLLLMLCDSIDQPAHGLFVLHDVGPRQGQDSSRIMAADPRTGRTPDVPFL